MPDIIASKKMPEGVQVLWNEGGAVKSGEYLGKTIRWYYAKGVDGVIIYAKNGNKVPRSEGAKPAMQLPEVFPDDVDFDWYVTEAREMLKGLGYGI